MKSPPGHILMKLENTKGKEKIKNHQRNRAQCTAPVVPATWETEAGGWLEARSLRTAWVT
jgi:hypothetical protein